jgi:hypothetical protein
MRVKTFLLGSAAAVAVIGGAQAADLSIAEPVDYVRVCDAFGVGYWYIPGTDTCIKLGGSVEFTANFHAVSKTLGGTDTDIYVVDDEDGSSLSNFVFTETSFLYIPGPGENIDGGEHNDTANDHHSHWDFVTSIHVTVTAKSMTEHGELVGFVDLAADSNNSQWANEMTSIPDQGNNLEDAIVITNGYYDTDRIVRIDAAWLSLGPLLAGRLGSTYDPDGGFSDIAWRSDSKTDQLRLTWAASGFGLMFGIEDPRDRWGTDLASTYSMPDLIAAATVSQGHVSAKLSAGFADLAIGNVYGVNGSVTVKLDALAPGDAIRFNAAYGTGKSFVGGPLATNGTASWTAFASFQHYFAPTLSGAVTVSYANAGGVTQWAGGANLVWKPYAGFSTTVQGTYTAAPSSGGTSSWAAKVALKREW